LTLFVSVPTFREAFEAESGKTRDLLASLTDDALSQRIAPGVRNLGEVAWHLPQSLGSICGQLGLVIDAPPAPAPAPGTLAELMEAYDRARSDLLVAVGAWSDEALLDVTDVYGEQWTRGHTLRVLLDHEIHHRGQCVVLMRQAGLEPPPLYGPVKHGVPDPFDAGPPVPMERLEPPIRRAWLVENLLFWVVCTGVMAAAEWFWVPEWLWWPLPMFVGGAVLSGLLLIQSLLWPWLSYAAWRYRIRVHDVELIYGVLWRVRRSVPRPRIQHVDVRSGPLDRAFGLAKCTLFTAGTGEADATIPGLSPEVAEALRERLLQDAARNV